MSDPAKATYPSGCTRSAPLAQSKTGFKCSLGLCPLLKRGPKWVAGKPAGEQALGNHGRYLQEQMTKGALQLAGPFLDDSGGLILYNARDEAEVRAIAEHDPGVVDGILAVESTPETPLRLRLGDSRTRGSPLDFKSG